MSSQVNDFASLRELILLEDFKKCAPEHYAVYLNEKKVSQQSEAAVFADEYMLPHKEVFATPCKQDSSLLGSRPVVNVTPVRSKDERECYYCHAKGHVVKNCLQAKRKLNLRM